MQCLQQEFYNIFLPLFLKLRKDKNPDPFKDFEDFRKGITLPAPTKGTVLLVPIRVSPVANLFEGIFGYFLKLKGYDVKAFLCGQNLSMCESFAQGIDKKMVCASCLNKQKQFVKSFDIEPLWIDDLLSKNQHEDIAEAVTGVNLKSKFNFVYKDVDLTTDVSSGIQRYTLTSEPDVQKYSGLLKEIMTSAATMVESVYSIVAKEKIEFVVMSHGIYSTWGAFLSAVKKQNLQSLVWGRGYIGQGNMIIGKDKSYLEDFITEPNSLWEDVELTSEEREFVLNYYNSKKAPNSKVERINYYDSVKNQKENTDSDIRKELDIPENAVCMAMFTNIPWDGQAFCSNEEFPSIRNFLKAVIDWFKNNKEIYLIIRAHPAELFGRNAKYTERFQDVLFDMYPELPENVKFLEPAHHIRSYDLIDTIDAGVVFASTIALEMFIHKVPIIQTGRNAMSNKEILFNVKTVNELEQSLDKVRNKGLTISDKRYERGLRYAHYWMKRRHIPEEVIKLNNLYYQDFLFRTKEELEQNVTLNFILDKILKHEYFVLDK